MYAVGSGALVKIIDVLGAEIEPLTQFLFDLCKSFVGSIRPAARASRRRME
jgi:hypothetical protein